MLENFFFRKSIPNGTGNSSVTVTERKKIIEKKCILNLNIKIIESHSCVC